MESSQKSFAKNSHNRIHPQPLIPEPGENCENSIELGIQLLGSWEASRDWE
jgi:hypothetical protein